MTEQVSKYPFDYASDRLCAVLQDKPVVALTSWIAQCYAAAITSERNFAVITPSSAAVTLPLAVLLSETGCQWVATSPTNALYDGFTGRSLHWTVGGITPRGEAEVDSSFLLAEPRPRGYVHVRAETVHQASFAAPIGTFTQVLFESLTGHAPVGWGLHEPVSERWDTAAVSSFAFARSPRSTRLIVVGAPDAGSSVPVPAIALMTIERTASAVVESVELLLDREDPLDPADLGDVTRALHSARARTALVGHGVGYSGLTRPARFTGSTVPAAAVFGSETISATGSSRALALARESGGDARLLGVAPAHSLAVLYPQEQELGGPHPLEAYAALARSLAVLPPA